MTDRLLLWLQVLNGGVNIHLTLGHMGPIVSGIAWMTWVDWFLTSL